MFVQRKKNKTEETSEKAKLLSLIFFAQRTGNCDRMMKKGRMTMTFAEWKEKILEDMQTSAMAEVRGSAANPDLQGKVRLFQTDAGVLVVADVMGLPKQSDCGGVFGFHIHEGSDCGGDAFADTKGHYNPKDCPPSLSCRGFAAAVFQ